MIKQKTVKKRGGARPGAGPKRKLKGGEFTPTYLDKETRDFMRNLGNGNLSNGIRIAAKMLSRIAEGKPAVEIEVPEEESS